ncbi:hypothetical protein Q5P01_022910 [Channa striata]|uniref:Uncharacterized protein n=1 Tax=Channa striata TaxID=64152 RepID=A0AA88LRU1_CHASR|nr:hypothetical protein Q5P01_022910 [Channa striata]
MLGAGSSRPVILGRLLPWPGTQAGIQADADIRRTHNQIFSAPRSTCVFRGDSGASSNFPKQHRVSSPEPPGLTMTSEVPHQWVESSLQDLLLQLAHGSITALTFTGRERKEPEHPNLQTTSRRILSLRVSRTSGKKATKHQRGFKRKVKGQCQKDLEMCCHSCT